MQEKSTRVRSVSAEIQNESGLALISHLLNRFLVTEPGLRRCVFQLVFKGVVQPVVNGIAEADTFHAELCKLRHCGEARYAQYV